MTRKIDTPHGAPSRVSRATAVYNVHAYHTKVPVEGIVPFIEANTAAGQVVIDPFCGSGMTGIAAATSGRRAILNDLSPAAVHIAHNYTTPCSSRALAEAAETLAGFTGPQLEPLYEVSCPTCSGRAVTEYVIWSDLRACPNCATTIRVWDTRSGATLRTLGCGACGVSGPKAKAKVVGEEPAAVNVRCLDCRRRETIDPRPEDLALALGRAKPPYWYPGLSFGSDWDMWRGGHRDLGITEVADFWSPRNLTALSVLWEGIGRQPDDRLRDALRFVFTAIANRASRRYQWNAKRPTNVLGGTLYIASWSLPANRSATRRSPWLAKS